MLKKNNLAKIRQSAGMTQKQLADKLRVSISTVSQIENGLANIENYIDELATIFAFDKEELRGDKDVNLASKKDITQLRILNIGLLMAKQQITPSKLANLIGVTRNKITAFQGGFKRLNEKEYREIAEVLGVEREFLDKEPRFTSQPVTQYPMNPEYMKHSMRIVDKIHPEDSAKRETMLSEVYKVVYDFFEDAELESFEDFEKEIELDQIKLETKKKLLEIKKNIQPRK